MWWWCKYFDYFDEIIDWCRRCTPPPLMMPMGPADCRYAEFLRPNIFAWCRHLIKDFQPIIFISLDFRFDYFRPIDFQPRYDADFSKMLRAVASLMYASLLLHFDDGWFLHIRPLWWNDYFDKDADYDGIISDIDDDVATLRFWCRAMCHFDVAEAAVPIISMWPKWDAKHYADIFAIIYDNISMM